MTHVVVQLTISDQDALMAYRAKAADAMAVHGGAFLQVSGDLAQLEGEAPLPTIMGVLTFPSADDAKAWINDPALAEVHALRNKAGTSTITLLG
ncbi:DUF1330 domain-containing protein [Pseudoprimorskyibacter insulae]|uniref:DUF1330 domain-containing protein n=1 Tax=Pseudoprimorskyibacter insulae TaxID=1695997 RepID=A0A2R8AUV0_9RHOB|nr:DUF1330 domain-containing protein [Pseudoprimorskyibacter insulae]SPF79664.1 hypothetical protein PRI8871_01461 [Pseudoprimorskyibacter insulae]